MVQEWSRNGQGMVEEWSRNGRGIVWNVLQHCDLDSERLLEALFYLFGSINLNNLNRRVAPLLTKLFTCVMTT